MNVYCISGLGADKRVFQKIDFPEGTRIIHLDWISPHANESLAQYAMRMSAEIDQSQPYFLIGLSFGGMVVVELARKLNPVKSIIISSISTGDQLPWYLKNIPKFMFGKLIPLSLFKKVNPFFFWLFGIKTEEEKQLLRQIFKDTDLIFLRWAIKTIGGWKNNIKPPNLVHIHGTNDHIFPIRLSRPDIRVENGGHFMIFSLSKTISELISKELVDK